MRKFLALILLFTCFNAQSQKGWYRASLHRADGIDIVFHFEWKSEKGKDSWTIHNASEKIRVTDITRQGDSIFVQMPVFESQFRFVYRNKILEGVWMKGSSSRTQIIPFTAIPSSVRFTAGQATKKNITGRWAVIFTSNGNIDTSVAEFRQSGNNISGTFLTATGDYRYQEGIIRGDSLILSCFDGGHAFLFTAHIDNNKTISSGWRYSGAAFKEEWTARKDPHAAVPFESSSMHLLPGEDHLDFTFNDIDGKLVSINDQRFKNKVVVIQIMGSWCPNCMDETAFLSSYYDHNRERGVEIISLAYEYSTDMTRSRNSLRKFQQKFGVKYPMLITGVSVADSLRTEKTLPQVTAIKFFPSSIVIDKKGKVRKFDTSFNGPGTGEHYTEYKKEFEATINKLLKEE